MSPKKVSTPAESATAVQASAQSTQVGEVMSRSAVCLNPEVRLHAVTQMFLDRGISSAPIVDDAWRPMGILSKTDILRTLSEDPSAPPDLQGHASDVMTPNVLSLPQDAPMTVAAALMAYEGVHRLPVVAPSGEVVGVVSTLDIVKWVARMTDTAPSSGKGAVKPIP
jgi:CBS domain-containing protein